MNETISKALQISALGIGLVFLSILILWVLLELAVRITATKKPQIPGDKPQKPSKEFLESRRKAVAAAVVTAMALKNTAFTSSSHGKREAITPWQAAHRSQQLRQAQAASTRKKKGS